MVFSGLVTAWRLAGWPTRRSPSSVNATIEGVVRAPSAFSITFGVLPSITATQEFVVPRSMPMTLPMTFSSHVSAGRPGPFGTWTETVRGANRASLLPTPNTGLRRNPRRYGSYRRAHFCRKAAHQEFSNGGRPLAVKAGHRRPPGRPCTVKGLSEDFMLRNPAGRCRPLRACRRPWRPRPGPAAGCARRSYSLAGSPA